MPNISSLLVRFFLKGFAALPVTLACRTAGLLGWLFGRIRTKDFNIAASQLRFALSLTQAQAEALARKNFACVGYCAGEAFMIPKIIGKTKLSSNEIKPASDFPNFSLEMDSEQILTVGQASGSIVLSGHIGCIELLAAYYVARGLDLYAIGRAPNAEWINSWVSTLRENYQVQTIWREDPRSTSKILRALKSGATISALIDQDTKLESIYSNFFGLPAASPVALLKLAVRVKIPIFSCFLAGERPGQYVIRSRRLHYSSEDPKAIPKILNHYNQDLEGMIRRFPQQWVWWHKRWRRRPGIDYVQNPEKLTNSLDYAKWIAKLDRSALELPESHPSNYSKKIAQKN